jgi:hypothetical protein
MALPKPSCKSMLNGVVKLTGWVACQKVPVTATGSVMLVMFHTPDWVTACVVGKLDTWMLVLLNATVPLTTHGEVSCVTGRFDGNATESGFRT